MICRLGGREINRQRITSQVGLLTVHDRPHILDEAVNDLESLSYDVPSLVLRESVESLQDCLTVLLLFLYEFD